MPWADDEHWDGFTERRHDAKCSEHRSNMREWVEDQIKIATIPSKVRTILTWSIVVAMLVAAMGSGYYSRTAAQEAAQIAADQKATDTQQSADIEHNEEQLRVVVEAHEKMVETQEEMKKDINDINLRQTRILTILERIEKKVE